MTLQHGMRIQTASQTFRQNALLNLSATPVTLFQGCLQQARCVHACVRAWREGEEELHFVY